MYLRISISFSERFLQKESTYFYKVLIFLLLLLLIILFPLLLLLFIVIIIAMSKIHFTSFSSFYNYVIMTSRLILTLLIVPFRISDAFRK